MDSIFYQRAKAEFLHYGFTDIPLTKEEVSSCHRAGLGIPKVYSIGCDVNSGFPFEECLEEAIMTQEKGKRYATAL